MRGALYPSKCQGNTRLYWVPPLMQWAKLPQHGKCILEGRKVLHERWFTQTAALNRGSRIEAFGKVLLFLIATPC